MGRRHRSTRVWPAAGLLIALAVAAITAAGCADDSDDQPGELERIDQPAQVDPSFVPGEDSGRYGDGG